MGRTSAVPAAGPRRAGRPAGADGDVRMALLRAAATRFSTNGYAATTTREILEEAGVTAPALYHQFGSKAGLYTAVATAAYDEVLALFGTAAEPDDPVDRLAAAIDCVVVIRREHPRVAQLFAVIDHDVSRHHELGELGEYQARFDALWHAICGPGASPDSALAMRAVVEGFLRVGTEGTDPDRILAAGAVLSAVVRAGRGALV